MKQNRFSVHWVSNYKDHVIRAEKRSLFFTMEYSLVIDGFKQDQILGTYGILTLHGNIRQDGTRVPVELIIHQGLLSARFYCRVEDNLIQMNPFDPNVG